MTRYSGVSLGDGSIRIWPEGDNSVGCLVLLVIILFAIISKCNDMEIQQQKALEQQKIALEQKRIKTDQFIDTIIYKNPYAIIILMRSEDKAIGKETVCGTYDFTLDNQKNIKSILLYKYEDGSTLEELDSSSIWIYHNTPRPKRILRHREKTRCSYCYVYEYCRDLGEANGWLSSYKFKSGIQPFVAEFTPLDDTEFFSLERALPPEIASFTARKFFAEDLVWEVKFEMWFKLDNKIYRWSDGKLTERTDFIPGLTP